MLSKTHIQNIEERQRLSMAIIIVFLMLASSLLAIVQTVHDQPDAPKATQLVDGGSIGMTLFNPPIKVAKVVGKAAKMVGWIWPTKPSPT